MLKNMRFVVVALSLGAGCGGEPPAVVDREDALGEAFGHAHFQATYRMLEARGALLDLASATVAPSGDLGGFVLRIPVSGGRATELRFETRGGQSPEVSVRESRETVEDQAALAPCGPYTGADSCSQGPWPMAQQCANGPLYRYDLHTRRIFTNGWAVTFETSIYSCEPAQPSLLCYSSCTPIAMNPRHD